MARKKFLKTSFSGDRLKKILETFILENTGACVPRPWPLAFLYLAARGSALGRAVFSLDRRFFCVLGLGLEPCVLIPPLVVTGSSSFGSNPKL